MGCLDTEVADIEVEARLDGVLDSLSIPRDDEEYSGQFSLRGYGDYASPLDFN